MESSRNLFGSSVDLACGKVRYMTAREPQWKRWWLVGRFMRGYYAPKTAARLLGDTLKMAASLRLDKSVSKALTFKTVGGWVSNSFGPGARPPKGFRLEMRSAGERKEISDLPIGVRGMVSRMTPSLSRALAAVYRNDTTPIEKRLGEAVGHVVSGLRLSDMLIGLLAGAVSGACALGSAVIDLLRYYVFKVSAAKMLAERVTADSARIKDQRELTAAPADLTMAGRLATNTYQEGSAAHIRVLWPDTLPEHGQLADAPYWSVCPAGVYAFEPSLAGHGEATVNWENCIKCESCWQSAGAGVRWGRHTDHRLIYRPDTPALDLIMPHAESTTHAPHTETTAALPEQARGGIHAEPLKEVARLAQSAHAALTQFEIAAANVPRVADATRLEWPRRTGDASVHRLRALETELTGSEILLLPMRAGLAHSPFTDLAQALADEGESLSGHLRNGDLFEAVASARRVRETAVAELFSVLGIDPPGGPVNLTPMADPFAPGAVESALRQRFPDTRIKEWERYGLEGAAARELADHFNDLTTPTAEQPLPADTLAHLRAWSSIHAGVATLGLARIAARSATGNANAVLMDGSGLSASPDGGNTRLSGTLVLVPAALGGDLIITRDGHAHTVSGDDPGLSRRKVAAGGLHPAGFETIQVDVTVPAAKSRSTHAGLRTFLAYGYGTIALGAGDYLARRSLEQGLGRIQFPGQMKDTQGHDGVAKFGAVKALVARTLAWRGLTAAVVEHTSGQPDLAAAVAALAFCPKNGRMSYDAGQTFGGTGYSEDDLLARFYRDSSVFPFLAPGHGAVARVASEWRGDRSIPLAARLIPEAASAFAQLAEGPFSDEVQRWQRAAAQVDRLEADNGIAREATVLAVALFHMLTGAGRDLTAGQPVEDQSALLRVLLAELEQMVRQATTLPGAGAPATVAHFPEIPDRDPIALPISYAQLVERDDPYSSGDFLLGKDVGQPRFIPEIQLHDLELRDKWEHCYHWFLERCGRIPGGSAPDGDGFYEHYIERIHSIPPDMLEGFKEHGFFCTVVPKELDGLGWRKIGYYLLVSGAMRHGDASLSLLIMASTSIGITPVLIGLGKEVPLVSGELSAFASEPARLGDIQKGLDAIVKNLDRPDPGKLERDFKKLLDKVDGLRKTKVVKYLAQNFLKAFYTAALAGQRRDFSAFADGLRQAQPLLAKLPETVRHALDELPRRERAHQFFLRGMSHGGVAAFALTEPTAGSDSGGVTTTGHLKSATVEPLPDGRFRFEIDGNERFLLDADRIEFKDRSMLYKLADGTLAPVSTATYDYQTDQGVRTVKIGGKDLPFHDIAQVREGNVYEFYELTGAKMWITNGRVCTHLSMYVKTDEGITGLMVDRHAEGLIIGRDEDKMGQQGSPTNEIAIDRARVPREGVIGYEGHGQVNALDTLNVGRCGLATASVVMGRRMLVEALKRMPDHPDRERVLAECSARIFATESLVFHLIGRFDNHHTESLRMESAIAKYACSEMFHDVLDRIEGLWGPAGQTRDELLEKARRDARILNIYEGTNEVQRFLILRELAGMIKTWAPVEIPEDDAFGVRMAHHKERLRRYVAEADDRLGDSLWLDAAIQPAFFPLAEMAGELYQLDTVIYRLRWLDEQRAALGDYATTMIAVGERAAEQCLDRLEELAARYEQGRRAALDSRYPAEVVASDAAMQERSAQTPPVGVLNLDMTITCLVRPAAVVSPRPRLDDLGQIAERVWQMHPADEAALATALEIAARAHGRVTVQAVSCGGAQGEQMLRDALAAGAESATLLPIPAHATPAEWATALKGVKGARWGDLVVCGKNGADGESPIGAAVAAALVANYLESPSVGVTDGGDALTDANGQVLGPNTVVCMDRVGARVNATVSGRVVAGNAGIARPTVDMEPARVAFSHREGTPAAGQVATTPTAAASRLMALADAVRQHVADPVSGTMGKAPRPGGDGIWAFAQAHETRGALAAFGAAVQLGKTLGIPARALVTGSEDGIRAVAGLARDAGISSCHAVNTDGAALSFSGARKLVSTVIGDHPEPCRVVAPRAWGPALAAAGANGPAVMLFGVTGIEGKGATLKLVRPAYDDKLVQMAHVEPARGLLFTVADSADFGLAGPVTNFALTRDEAAVGPDDLDPTFVLPVDTLANADVIVDVGYGAGSDAGLRLANDLVAALKAMGLSPHLGATRKITQGLGLMGLDHQIGQTGLRVNPQILFALGISGAPQHVDYIGGRAQVFAFNRDPDAPLMSMRKPGVTVHPVAGDLFATVPELIRALRGGPEPGPTSPGPKTRKPEPQTAVAEPSVAEAPVAEEAVTGEGPTESPVVSVDAEETPQVTETPEKATTRKRPAPDGSAKKAPVKKSPAKKAPAKTGTDAAVKKKPATKGTKPASGKTGAAKPKGPKKKD
ncbi:MAG: acyl-CoA dehydrogenase family protein [Nitrospirota bacterium]|nr:acyl-CoA dehydrogenase family protein [Nitrospirota bacterium]